MSRTSQSFTLKQYHLDLLRRSYVEFDEDTWAYDGNFMQDPKRPYGNSDVLDDLLEIVNPNRYAELQRIRATEEVDAEYWEEKLFDRYRDELMRIHAEVAVAAQIVLFRAGSETPPGEYHRPKQYDTRTWVLVLPEPSS